MAGMQHPDITKTTARCTIYSGREESEWSEYAVESHIDNRQRTRKYSTTVFEVKYVKLRQKWVTMVTLWKKTGVGPGQLLFVTRL